MGVLRDSKIFRAPICKAHRAVVFAVVQLFVLTYSFDCVTQNGLSCAGVPL